MDWGKQIGARAKISGTHGLCLRPTVQLECEYAFYGVDARFEQPTDGKLAQTKALGWQDAVMS